MLPSFSNEIVELLKLTALVSLVGLSDITFRANELQEHIGHPVAIYCAVLVIYFLLGYPIVLLGRKLETYARSRVGVNLVEYGGPV
jgi:polar amino acid transport system permease protein